MVMDWNPDVGRMQNYRLLDDSDDAYSGEEYFLRTPGGSQRRRYRRTNSEREADEEEEEVEREGDLLVQTLLLPALVVLVENSHLPVHHLP